MTTSMLEKKQLPEVTTLPPLDEDAAQLVADDLYATMIADDPADPRQRIKIIAERIKNCTRELAEARAARNAAAYTVATQYRIKRGAAPYAALGVGRNRWKVIRDQLRQSPPAPVGNALEQLPHLAIEAAARAIVLDYVLRSRVEAVAELREAGLKNVEVSAILGRHPGRVSHLLARAAS